MSTPAWHFGQMAAAEPGYRFLVEQHYRYYQNAANMVVALAAVLACRLAAGVPFGATEVLLLACAALFFVGSRDALAKYYRRGEQLLRPRRGGPARRKAAA